MKISGLSHLLKVIKPEPVVERTARAMAANPGAAREEFGKLVTFINNTAHANGVGYVGGDARTAAAALQQAVAETAVDATGRSISTQDFARQLKYLGPIKQNLEAQKGRLGVTPGQDQAIDTALDLIGGLQNFRGPR